MNKLIFGPEIWQLQKVGGISRYFSELIPRLLEISNQLFKIEVWADGKDNALLAKMKSDVPVVKANWSTVLKHDMYHQTFFNAKNVKLAKNHGAKTINTLYDMVPEKLELESKLTFRFGQKRQSLKFTDNLICISNTTKMDFESLTNFRIPTRVIHLGTSSLRNAIDVKLPNFHYFVYVGNRHNYKNFSLLLDAAKLLKESHSFGIIAIGGEEFSSDELLSINTLAPEITVVRLLCEDRQLWTIMRESIALIVTSRYEGFSLPILDALSDGISVLCSDIPVHRELYSGCVTQFDPDQAFTLAQVMRGILENPEEFQVSKNCRQYFTQNFTWKSCAEQHIKTYIEIANGP